MPRRIQPAKLAHPVSGIKTDGLPRQAVCGLDRARGGLATDPIMASAALDRLLHRSTVVHIRGDSYRLKEKRQAKSQPLEG
jgi:hypothetical protein